MIDINLWPPHMLHTFTQENKDAHVRVRMHAQTDRQIDRHAQKQTHTHTRAHAHSLDRTDSGPKARWQVFLLTEQFGHLHFCYLFF